jgi:hypothetical protein
VKKVHNWGDESSSSSSSSSVNNIPQINLHEASKSRHLKKIRIDGSTTGINQKIVFNDDGDIEDTTISNQIIGNTVSATTSTATATLPITASDNGLLASAREEYLQKVRNRLSKTKELDRREEKERIQDKHKKRKLKDRSSDGGDGGDISVNDDNDGGRDTVVTLGPSINSDDGDDDQNSTSSNDSDNTDTKQDGDLYEDDSSEDGDDDDDDECVDVKAQEELALAMIGN